MKSSCLLLAFFIMISLISCKGKEQATAQISPDINVVEAGQRTVPVYTEYVGQTYGVSDVEIQARVDGWITSMRFKEGGMVQQGELLYTIDDQPTLTKVHAAEAQLASAGSQLSRTKSDGELTKKNKLI